MLRYSYRSLTTTLPALGLMDRTFRGCFPLIASRMKWAAFFKVRHSAGERETVTHPYVNVMHERGTVTHILCIAVDVGGHVCL